MNTLNAYVGNNVNKRTITSPSNTKLKYPIIMGNLNTELVIHKNIPRIIQGYSENLCNILKENARDYKNNNKKVTRLQERERNSEIFLEDYQNYEDFEDIHIFLKSQHITTHNYR